MNDEDPIGEPVPPYRDDAWISEPLADMKKREANQLPPFFFPLLAGALVWLGIGIWLMHKLHWPEAYGFATCRGVHGCMFLDLVRSPALLNHPTGTSLALFAWFMSIVTAILAIIIHAARTKPRGQYLMLLAIIAGCFVALALSPEAKAVW